MDASEETAHTLLTAQVPSLAKALLNQIKSPKTNATVLQTGFGVLHTLLTVLPGSLSAQTPQIITISKSVLSQNSSTSTSTLQLAVLSFLSLLFSSHSPSSFSGSLSSITPVLLQLLEERHPRVASETFRVFSSLISSLSPIKSGDWVDSVYNKALTRLSNHDTDAEVRACAEECIGNLWVAAPEIMKTKGRKEWEYICRSSGKTDGAVKVVTKVASQAPVDDEWANGVMQWLINLLQKSGRAGKAEVFGALEVLIKSYSAGVPKNLSPALVPHIKPYISTSDISLLAQALTILATLLELSPETTFPEVESDVLAEIYKISHSPLVSGPALEVLFRLFAALVQADDQISTHLVPNLVISSEKAPPSENNPANVAKCIAQVVRYSQGVAAGVIAEYSKNLKVRSYAF